MIVDHNAAVDGDAGVFRQCDVGANAGRKNHRVGSEQTAIGQFDAFDALVAGDPRGVGVEQDLDALALEQRFQQFTRRTIELALHQPVHQMQQSDPRAGLGQTIGRFQSQQAAAHHDHALPLRGQGQQQIDIPGVAKGVHAQKIGAGYIEPQRRGAGGQDQFGKMNAFFVGDLEFAAADIDLGGAAAIFQGDAAVAPPCGGFQFNVMRLGFT